MWYYSEIQLDLVRKLQSRIAKRAKEISALECVISSRKWNYTFTGGKAFRAYRGALKELVSHQVVDKKLLKILNNANSLGMILPV